MPWSRAIVSLIQSTRANHSKNARTHTHYQFEMTGCWTCVVSTCKRYRWRGVCARRRDDHALDSLFRIRAKYFNGCFKAATTDYESTET